MAVTEVYRSYLGGQSSDPTWVRVFDVDGTPNAVLLTPDPALPQFGDSFPDDPTLLVDQIELLERRSPDLTRVGIAYRRVTFEGQNVTRTDTHPDGPFVIDTYASNGESLSVPRIIKITDNAGADFLEFQQYNQTILIPSTTLVRTVHTESWDNTKQLIVDGQIDWIHGDLIQSPARARFIGAQVDRIGNRLWRIQYSWSIKFPLSPITSPALSIPGGDYTGTLLDVTNSQNAGGNPAEPIPGSFPAHSVPMLLIPQALDTGLFQFGQDPIYYPDRVWTFEGTFTVLPGLESL